MPDVLSVGLGGGSVVEQLQVSQSVNCPLKLIIFREGRMHQTSFPFFTDVSSSSPPLPPQPALMLPCIDSFYSLKL